MEEKIKQELRSLEFRKESVFSTINAEIIRLQNEKQNILLEAGTLAYDVWCKDKTKADLTECWSKIQELEKAIAEQETKRIEMGNRYDEEIRLISSSLNVPTGSPVNVSPANINTANISVNANKCSKCGAPVSADDVFCQNCGNKLK